MIIDKELFLAPIHEYTNYPFRELCKKYGAKYTLVPLVSSMGLVSSEKYIEKIDYFNSKNEGIQIFGNDAKKMKKSIDILMKKFSNLNWVDINCGCPSRNVIQSGGGSALLKNPKLVKEIIEETKRSGITISVKMRLCNSLDKTIDFVNTIEPDFITIHGRTVEQMYSGHANWNEIKDIKKRTNKKIIGNGDIKDYNEAKDKIKDKYCDAVMIGRNAMSNPGCFSNLEVNKENKIKLIYEYLELLEDKEYYEKITLIKVKILNLLKGFENSNDIKNKISLAKDEKEIIKILETS